jgi:hypothetical protein
MIPATARFYEAVVNGQLTQPPWLASMAHGRAATLAGVTRDSIYI